MIFCKRCGSATLNGYCENCFGSNFIHKRLFNLDLGNDLDISPLTDRSEKILRLKTNFIKNDNANYLPKIKQSVSKNEEIYHTAGKISAVKAGIKYNLLDRNFDEKDENEGEQKRNLEPIENVLGLYPYIKARLDLKKSIEDKVSKTLDIKEYKLPPQSALKKPRKSVTQKKDNETRIYEIKD
ncbi:MAG: hypothetical protein ACTSRG_07640 [Candidatus Helarchaeota archaeon]